MPLIYKKTVTTTPSKILDFDIRRKSYAVYNSSSTYKIFVSYSKDSEFFPVTPNNYINFSKELGDATHLELWAKAESGSIDIYIIIGRE